MTKKLLSVFIMSLITLSYAFAEGEKLATCTITSDGSATDVIVEKLPGGLPAGAQHLTEIFQKNSISYHFSETFDGTENVGLASGFASGLGVSFNEWTFSPLPIGLEDPENSVSIRCQ